MTLVSLSKNFLSFVYLFLFFIYTAIGYTKHKAKFKKMFNGMQVQKQIKIEKREQMSTDLE